MLHRDGSRYWYCRGVLPMHTGAGVKTERIAGDLPTPFLRLPSRGPVMHPCKLLTIDNR
jgi:hypothetical protein